MIHLAQDSKCLHPNVGTATNYYTDGIVRSLQATSSHYLYGNIVLYLYEHFLIGYHLRSDIQG